MHCLSVKKKYARLCLTHYSIIAHLDDFKISCIGKYRLKPTKLSTDASFIMRTRNCINN